MVSQWPRHLTEADGSASLGTGAFVRADVLARLLGIKLLRIEADVVLAPAAPEVRARPVARARPSVVVATAPTDGACLGDARRLLADAELMLRTPTGAR